MLAADTFFRAGILATLAGFGWVMWKNRAAASGTTSSNTVGAQPRAKPPLYTPQLQAMRDSIRDMEKARKELDPILKASRIEAMQEWRLKAKQHHIRPQARPSSRPPRR